MPARIATLTVNPAVDLATTAKSVQPRHKIRTFDERYDPGGGGINVAKVVSELGGQTLALFASGGVTGRFIADCANVLEALRQVEADWVVASGSLPPGVPPDFYKSAASIVIGQGAKFVLDTSGPALTASLGSRC
jgi:6-phosphofructokinase 2